MAGSIETSGSIASQTSSSDAWENMLSGQPARQIIESDDPDLFVTVIPTPPTKLGTVLRKLKAVGKKK
ncbi:MAG TPA: hypothetical protein VMR77_00295 [Patescibacteria group bacterium]|nr:hypothetical protein [Patescibacteria group bacterium]